MNWLKSFFRSIMGFFSSSVAVELVVYKALENNPDKRARLKTFVEKAKGVVGSADTLLSNQVLDKLLDVQTTSLSPLDRELIKLYLTTIIPSIDSPIHMLPETQEKVGSTLNRLSEIIEEVEGYAQKK